MYLCLVQLSELCAFLSFPSSHLPLRLPLELFDVNLSEPAMAHLGLDSDVSLPSPAH